jgi:hypothetical protein
MTIQECETEIKNLRDELTAFKAHYKTLLRHIDPLNLITDNDEYIKTLTVWAFDPQRPEMRALFDGYRE